MKSASIYELKQELLHESQSKVLELCLRLAKFKKENKELLTYLLFEAGDIDNFIFQAKNEMDGEFAKVNTSNIYFAKKTIRRILRLINMYIRYSASEIVASELLLHFCKNVSLFGDTIKNSPVVCTIYKNQEKKISKSISAMHEDLQFEYLRRLNGITI